MSFISNLPYIYKIVTKIDTKGYPAGSIYIGKHCGNDKSYFSGGTIVNNLRNKYGKTCVEREIIVNGNFNKELLNDLEIHYIRLYGSFINGLNLTSGGDGGFNRPPKEVHMYKMSGEYIGSFKSIYYAAYKTGVSFAAISKVVSGKHKSSGGYRWSYDNASNIGKYNLSTDSIIYQYDLDGNLLKEWLNSREIVDTYGSRYKTRVLSSVLRKNKFDNSLWSKSQICYSYDGLMKKGYKIVQRDLNNNIINYWNNAAEAGKHLGFDKSRISAVCRNKTSKAYGYNWSYLE